MNSTITAPARDRSSHRYDFRARDLALVIAMPLGPVLLFALAVHLGAITRLLPPPRPSLDTDRTILFHQAESSRTPQRADILLAGDSSCLMDVSGEQLTTALPGHSVLNLGTLSYLDLHAFGEMIRHYLVANPGKLKTVVLLMNPQALRRPSPAEYDVQALDHFYAGLDFCGPNPSALSCALGVESFRGRVLSRLVPHPLPGGYGRQYGFTSDLWNYLSAHQGSAIDPGQFDPARAHGNSEFRLAKSLDSESRAFRRLLPPGTLLAIGITPVPDSFVGREYERLYQRLLRDWNESLHADAQLASLPGRLPDQDFASVTHLNRAGIRRYTELLGRELMTLPLPAR